MNPLNRQIGNQKLQQIEERFANWFLVWEDKIDRQPTVIVCQDSADDPSKKESIMAKEAIAHPFAAKVFCSSPYPYGLLPQR